MTDFKEDKLLYIKNNFAKLKIFYLNKNLY